jgi:hypothetical protein
MKSLSNYLRESMTKALKLNFEKLTKFLKDENNYKNLKFEELM